jgi:hypothetical protein
MGILITKIKRKKGYREQRDSFRLFGQDKVLHVQEPDLEDKALKVIFRALDKAGISARLRITHRLLKKLKRR